MNARLIREYLDQLCRDLDAGRPLRRFAPALARVALPAAIGLSAMGLAGCDHSSHGDTTPNPGYSREVGTDPTDRDGDGLADSREQDYHVARPVTPPPPNRARPEICGDGQDNDLDGDTDCDDADCVMFEACRPAVTLYGAPPEPPPSVQEVCNDGTDNDNDGRTDCADPDCRDMEYCGHPPGPEICTDGRDNDTDGLIDCADADCRGTEICAPQPPQPQPMYGVPFEPDQLGD